jgi:hypothetical protein
MLEANVTTKQNWQKWSDEVIEIVTKALPEVSFLSRFFFISSWQPIILEPSMPRVCEPA